MQGCCIKAFQERSALHKRLEARTVFAIEFRVGSEYHDVYTYGSWMSVTICDEELVTFELAEAAANDFIQTLFMREDDYSGTWQIRSIERVPMGPVEWPTEYVL
jgi:hypothetical protein